MKSDIESNRGRWMRRLWLPIILLSGCASVAIALADEAQPFSPGNPHGMELKLPAGWTAVDPEMLELLRSAQRQPVAGFPTVDGFYAFSRVSATNEFDPPYLLVAIKAGGKLPDRVWRKLLAPGEAFRQLDAVLRRAPLEGCRLLDASFDTNLFATRMEMEMQSRYGTLRGSSVSFLTENGFIEIGAVMWPSNHAAWKKTFEDTVSSVQLAGWLQYRKGELVDLSGGATDWAYPVGGVAVLAIGGLIYIRHLRNRDTIDL